MKQVQHIRSMEGRGGTITLKALRASGDITNKAICEPMEAEVVVDCETRVRAAVLVATEDRLQFLQLEVLSI